MGVFYTSIANILPQIITLLFTAIISRIYYPVDFAQNLFIYSAAQLVSILHSMQLNYIILHEKNDSDAAKTLNLSFWLVLLITLVSFGFIYLMGRVFKNDFNEVFCILLLSCAITFFSIANSFAIKISAYKIIMFSAIFKSIAVCIFQVAAASHSKFINGISNLVLGSVFGELLSAAILITVFFYIKKINSPKNLNISSLYKLKTKILSLAVSQIISMGSNFAPILFMKYSEFMDGLGYFAFCMRIIVSPSNAFLGALRSDVAKKSNFFTFDKIKKYTTLYILLAVLFLPAAKLIVFNNINYGYFFGEAWGEIGGLVFIFFVWVVSSGALIFPMEFLKNNDSAFVVKCDMFMLILKLTAMIAIFNLLDARMFVGYLIIFYAVLNFCVAIFLVTKKYGK